MRTGAMGVRHKREGLRDEIRRRVGRVQTGLGSGLTPWRLRERERELGSLEAALFHSRSREQKTARRWESLEVSQHTRCFGP